MFDQAYVEQFYKEEIVTHPESIDDDFKKAYFMFIDVFCKATSQHWKKFVNDKLVLRSDGQYSPYLTTSDEALTLWLLQQEFNKAKEDADLIAKYGPEEWNKNREKRKRGQHTCLAKQTDYVALYNKISIARSEPLSQEFWQNQYFDYLFSTRGPKELAAMNRKRAIRNSLLGEEQAHPLPFDETF
jgi:hypothetical protein